MILVNLCDYVANLDDLAYVKHKSIFHIMVEAYCAVLKDDAGFVDGHAYLCKIYDLVHEGRFGHVYFWNQVPPHVRQDPTQYSNAVTMDEDDLYEKISSNEDHFEYYRTGGAGNLWAMKLKINPELVGYFSGTTFPL